MARPLCEIATEAAKDWAGPGKARGFWAAKPYLQAMACLTTMDQQYGCDSAESVVAYFLANASQWRGETARRIKAELNSMLKEARRC